MRSHFSSIACPKLPAMNNMRFNNMMLTAYLWHSNMSLVIKHYISVSTYCCVSLLRFCLAPIGWLELDSGVRAAVAAVSSLAGTYAGVPRAKQCPPPRTSSHRTGSTAADVDARRLERAGPCPPPVRASDAEGVVAARRSSETHQQPRRFVAVPPAGVPGINGPRR